MASLTEKQIGPGPVPVWDMQTASAGQIDACCGMGKGVNLLDNWYFLDPVNQRQWSGGSFSVNVVYSIDRWWQYNGVGSLSSNGYNLSGYFDFNQSIEPKLAELLQTTECIFSVLFTVDNQPDTHLVSCLKSHTGIYNTLNMLYATDVANYGPRIALYSTPDNSHTYHIIAVKAELGTVQTLAHRDTSGNWVLSDPPPNKSLELLKCQRYFQTFATTAWRPTQTEDFRPVMRANPTLGTITVGGKTLYTASADL